MTALARQADPAGQSALLDVSQSVTGRRWLIRDANEAVIRLIMQKLQVPELLARLLAGRGVSAGEAAGYLKPSLRTHLPDPSDLFDMDRAAERLARAIELGEQIAIFGDYDVDGATSSAILLRAIRACGSDATVYIPDRLSEGYGPNVKAMTALAEAGAKVIVTVDCGTQAVEPLAAAKTLGVDVIVCDHHQAGAALPPAFAIVNPNRPDDTLRLGQLCAAGVAFLMAVALIRVLRNKGWFSASRPEPDLMPLAGLVALGTVADVVPLTGVNRAFVVIGLKAMMDRPLAGLTALMAVAGLNKAPEPYHLGFLLGPRVNAGGRVGRCALGSELLSTDDPDFARRLALELDVLNRERQAIEALIIEEAMVEADGLAARGRAILVLAREGWHPGVIGIVAGRVKERLNRPCVVIGIEGGLGKGSARSVMGVDMGRAFAKARDEGLLMSGGGHAMAAGGTIAQDRIEAFAAFLERELAADAAASPEGTALFMDGVLSASGATAEFVAAVAAAGPYGAGNPEPLFVIPDLRIGFSKIVGQGHIRFSARGADGASISGIAFRSAENGLGDALLRSKGRPVHLAGALQINDWNGGSKAEMRLIDAAFAG